MSIVQYHGGYASVQVPSSHIYQVKLNMTVTYTRVLSSFTSTCSSLSKLHIQLKSWNIQNTRWSFLVHNIQVSVLLVAIFKQTWSPFAREFKTVKHLNIQAHPNEALHMSICISGKMDRDVILFLHSLMVCMNVACGCVSLCVHVHDTRQVWWSEVNFL